uniref:Uncharacterized protein n=1 Tax=Planktothricoides sp. SpSt-374 TaxID=2282167 RepID=A0A7C3ZKZ3_9CYAN
MKRKTLSRGCFAQLLNQETGGRGDGGTGRRGDWGTWRWGDGGPGDRDSVGATASAPKSLGETKNTVSRMLRPTPQPGDGGTGGPGLWFWL